MIEVSGLDDVVKMLENAEISEHDERRMLRCCYPLVAKLKEATPVDTENMRKKWSGGIRTIDGNKTYRIQNNDFGSVFVEYGTIYDKRHIGTFQRVIDENLQEVQDNMERIAREVIGDVG